MNSWELQPSNCVYIQDNYTLIYSGLFLNQEFLLGVPEGRCGEMKGRLYLMDHDVPYDGTWQDEGG